jgi:hypothetical protein
LLPCFVVGIHIYLYLIIKAVRFPSSTKFLGPNYPPTNRILPPTPLKKVHINLYVSSWTVPSTVTAEYGWNLIKIPQIANDRILSYRTYTRSRPQISFNSAVSRQLIRLYYGRGLRRAARGGHASRGCHGRRQGSLSRDWNGFPLYIHKKLD